MSTKTKCEQFWNFFESKQMEIEKALIEDNALEVKRLNILLNDQFIKVCGCYLMLSKQSCDFFECTFLPNTDKNSQILCYYVKKRAPKKVLDSWIINDCQPALSEKCEHLRFNVKDKLYSIDDIQIAIEKVQAIEAINAYVYCEGFEWISEEEAQVISEAFLRNVIGDVLYETRISEVYPGFSKLEDKQYCKLKDGYEMLIDYLEEKKWQFYSDLVSTYHIYKSDDPQLAMTYLKDRVLISTIHPELFLELGKKERTILNDFNRLGSEYGLLSFEIEEYNEQSHALKQSIEVSLRDSLGELGIGMVMGSSIGLKHLYFEVAVFDHTLFKRAIALLNQHSLALKYEAY